MTAGFIDGDGGGHTILHFQRLQKSTEINGGVYHTTNLLAGLELVTFR
jgi:hypothetical protein